ncbi:MAG TPA: hypothetical protein VHB20_12405 [Verrucomicrobiae bacterium]|jgi:hypothetical protein|nr:hypothetical protein [Verrucomicrobiae bacterium]
MKLRQCHGIVWAGLSLLVFGPISTYANVYATDIHLDGSLTNGWVAPGYPVRINYILNEPATGGVVARICAGSNVLRTFTAAGGQPGALAGVNEIFWDGRNSNGVSVAEGLYAVQISASSLGYADWTNITDDSSAFEVDNPRGLDVNKNTNSPYYGRVFVGNNQGLQPTGIYKFNADGSPAEDGAFSTGGYAWAGDGLSPWKFCVSDDDIVYVNDWNLGSRGFVLGFDEIITSNTCIAALGGDNYPTNTVDLSGPFVTGSGTNAQIWMADAATTFQSLGILRWNLMEDGTVAPSDPGEIVVAATNSDLTLAPYDVAVSTNGFIFTIQRVDALDADDAGSNPTNRVLCFPPETNNAPAETAALWKLGADDTNLANAYGVDINRQGSLVAVAVRGYGNDPEFFSGGNVSLFAAGDGHLVKRFGLGEDHQYMDVAWDNAGNLYALDFTAGVWRAYSPPGTNQSTTVGLARIQALSQLQAPQLSQPLLTNGLSFALHGQSNVTYIVQVSTDLTNWMDVVTNFDPAPDRIITAPATTDAQDFYRAVVAQP